jgi:hypothetical protein
MVRIRRSASSQHLVKLGGTREKQGGRREEQGREKGSRDDRGAKQEEGVTIGSRSW